MDSAPQAGMNADLASALQEAEARYSAANGKSQKIALDNCQHLPGGNTRTTLHFSPFPLVMTGGEGPWLIDADGHRYADFVNEYSAGLFGHSHPKIMASITATMKEGISLGGLNRYEGPLAQEIKRRFPSMDLIRFCNSGTEANLLAVGTARAISGKPAIMVFDGAYHGSLFYFNHGASPINPPIPIVTSVFNDVARASADIKANAAKLAAVIVEPMQGGAGCHAPLPGFLSALRQACDEAGVLLIFDEVMTSRLSPGGLQGLVGVEPDLTTLGKYIGGGLTLACFGGKAEIMARFDPRRPDAFPHGGTFNNNVLAMAAGVVGLTEVLTKERQEAMNKLGDKLRAGLIEVAKKHKVPLQGTGVGSIVGFHFTPTPPKNHLEIEAAQRGREGAVDALQKLMHFDLLAAGHYPARRGYAALSIETTDKQVSDLIAAVEEFCQTRGELVRQAFA